MASRRLRSLRVVSVAFFLVPHGFAQGTLEDYQRARSFLNGNLRHSVYIADVSPHWIGKTNRFWYHKLSPSGGEFIVADAEHNTAGPAFDHTRLAKSLGEATKRDVLAGDLPFDDIDFSQYGKSVHFNFSDARWTCSLSDYACASEPAEKPDESRSPDKKWSAFVKDHNLYVRNVSSGTVVPLTEDGVRGWDYATPLPALRLLVEQKTDDVKQPPGVFWSPDSSKLITYRIDSRSAGRFRQHTVRA